MSVLNIKQSYRIYNYTGLPRKDETLVNHQNTHLNSETKRQASNRHNSRVLGRLYSLILCGYPPVYVCNLLLVKSKHLERCDLSMRSISASVDRSWPELTGVDRMLKKIPRISGIRDATEIMFSPRVTKDNWFFPQDILFDHRELFLSSDWRVLGKELSVCHKLWFEPYISATKCRRP